MQLTAPAALPTPADVHGILGIAGMGVIIMAVLLMISGAGMVHDARRGRD